LIRINGAFELGAIINSENTPLFLDTGTGYASRYTYADERGEPDRLQRNQVPEKVLLLPVDDVIVLVQLADQPHIRSLFKGRDRVTQYLLERRVLFAFLAGDDLPSARAEEEEAGLLSVPCFIA
jgi:hypothetical protein